MSEPRTEGSTERRTRLAAAGAIVGIGALLAAAACTRGKDGDSGRVPTQTSARAGTGAEENGAMLIVTSSAFQANGALPRRATCEGGDVAPPLEWSGAPPGTVSYALIVDDPDAPDPAAPKTTWVHWVVFDIPASVTALPEGGALPPGAKVGLNDWKRAAYGGPCPPIGRHRYFHKIYALDTTLRLERPTKAELLAAMEGHVLGEGSLVGTYQKGG
jgi:Raf kinase inhibitor-like YbhB/YbcL family protein